MKIINNQTAEILSLGEATLEEGKKIVEIVCRTCYKLLNLITDDSAEKFVDRMIKSEHLSTLEHCTIYLKIPRSNIDDALFFSYNKYSETRNDGNYCYVTTNYRVIIENEMEDVLKYQCAYEPVNHIGRITIRMITNRQIANKFERHRVFSFSRESSHYCNYSKDKFDNELKFLKPTFGNFLISNEIYDEWVKQMERAEYSYLKLCKMGCNEQEAATVLPNSTVTELVMSGTTKDWERFFVLYVKGYTSKPHPHPLAYDLANKIYMLLKEQSIRIYPEH